MELHAQNSIVTPMEFLVLDNVERLHATWSSPEEVPFTQQEKTRAKVFTIALTDFRVRSSLLGKPLDWISPQHAELMLTALEHLCTFATRYQEDTNAIRLLATRVVKEYAMLEVRVPGGRIYVYKPFNESEYPAKFNDVCAVSKAS